MAHNHPLLALDVGEKRIGVAWADMAIRIAVAQETIAVDGNEIERLKKLINDVRPKALVVGYPRNQAGQPTAQTTYVEEFAAKLSDIGTPIVFQDESLTSVHAEELLRKQKKPYAKGDIDALATSLILQDYLEVTYGRV